MALLRHWRASPGAHVLFVNADEYLVYHAPLTGPALRKGTYLLFTLLFHAPALIANRILLLSALLRRAATGFRRFMAFCWPPDDDPPQLPAALPGTNTTTAAAVAAIQSRPEGTGRCLGDRAEIGNFSLSTQTYAFGDRLRDLKVCPPSPYLSLSSPYLWRPQKV